jgi:hypothetical protein
MTWSADPTGRHRVRYWDGEIWTRWVADGDTATEDEIPESGLEDCRVRFKLARTEYGIEPGDKWRKCGLVWTAERPIDEELVIELLAEIESGADHPAVSLCEPGADADVHRHRVVNADGSVSVLLRVSFAFEAPWPKYATIAGETWVHKTSDIGGSSYWLRQRNDWDVAPIIDECQRAPDALEIAVGDTQFPDEAAAEHAAEMEDFWQRD